MAVSPPLRGAANEPESWIESVDFSDAHASLAVIAERFAGWAPHLVSIITDSIVLPVLRPIYALPVGIKWPRPDGVTLVGDAAHLMSPFAGEGGNLAMYDGAELGQSIAATPDYASAALVAYEEGMFPRSRDVSHLSARNLELFFGANAPGSVVGLFSGAATVR